MCLTRFRSLCIGDSADSIPLVAKQNGGHRACRIEYGCHADENSINSRVFRDGDGWMRDRGPVTTR
jgi:hypothetical protein